MTGLVFLVDVLLTPIGFLAAVVAQDAPLAFLLVLPLAALLRVFARERSARIDQAIELSAAYRGTAFLLGEVIVADDEYTGEHSYGVIALSLEIADEHGPRRGRPPARRVRRAAARRRQDRRAEVDRQQARARSTTTSGRSCASTRSPASGCSTRSAAA